MAENIIVIDGQEYSFEPGETILQVAERNGVFIPTLCYLKTGSSPTGACRVCLVEVEGARSLMASCTVPAGPNMVVRTDTPAVVKARRMNLELLLASGQHNCLAQDQDAESWTDFQLKAMTDSEHKELCPAYGVCRLQDYAVRYKVRTTHFTPSETPFPIENVNPFIVRDFSRCILCGRCVQACNEVQVNNAISYGYRGSSSKIVAAGDRCLNESDCVFCGECVQVCPVGALVPVKDIETGVLSTETQKIRTTCPYCGVGCQMYLHVKDDAVVKVSGVEDVGPNYGSLCVKGRFDFDSYNHPDRLKTPLIRKNGELKEATWDEALNKVAENLTRIQKESGPDAIGVLTSASMTNEENYLAQKFTRATIRTNNIDNCEQLSRSSTVTGLAAAFGSGAMTNPIEDIEKADVILITGSNTTEEHPVLSSYVKRAVTFKGAKLIVVDPESIPITKFANHWLKQKIGTDVAWINGMMLVIIKEKLYDEAYVNSRTVGLDDLKKTVEKYTPEYVQEITGIDKDQLTEAARLYAGAKVASILYTSGITQQMSGTDNVKALANLAMLCGNVGVEGGGVNSLRGLNNAQGACDMGGLPNVFTDYQKVDDAEAQKRMKEAWNVDTLSNKPGLSASQMMEKAQAKELKALYIIGENPLKSNPDLNLEEGLENLDFLVVQDIFLTETAQKADVVLPATASAEKEGSFTNMERKVQRVRKTIPPPGKAKADWEIISDLSGRMGYAMDYGSERAIMQEIAQVTPSYSGIQYDRLEHDGIHWPCTGTNHPGTPCLHIEKFSCGQGVFHAIDYTPPKV